MKLNNAINIEGAMMANRFYRWDRLNVQTMKGFKDKGNKTNLNSLTGIEVVPLLSPTNKAQPCVEEAPERVC